MSAERLREAAALIRERAEAASEDRDGSWWGDDMGAFVDGIQDGEAEHIAAADPPFMLTVADLLDSAAARAESKIENGGRPDPVWSHERHALAVADAYLGRQS